jgi:hypothetical protein
MLSLIYYSIKEKVGRVCLKFEFSAKEEICELTIRDTSRTPAFIVGAWRHLFPLKALIDH